MKIGVCVSNETPNLKGKITSLFQKKINQSDKGWSNKFSEILNKKEIDYGYIYIDKDNWLQQIEKYDVLIWKPAFMGIESSQFLKEKVYFIQHIMNKRIFPNYETVWHFDSKVAQKYLFEYLNIRTPKTWVSFDYNESIQIAENINYPVIHKDSAGAGGLGVQLIKSKKKLNRILNYSFLGKKIVSSVFKTKHDRYGHMYIQKFMKNNSGDLRINIIGQNYATGFWRMNRKNDFRASGSGNIDYDSEIPREIIKFCANISKENNFDSMAYDIIFDQNGDYVIVEMSYAYSDSAIYHAKGYYILNSNCDVEKFVKGHFWPQELWVNSLIESTI